MSAELNTSSYILSYSGCVSAAGHSTVDHCAISNLHGTGIGLHYSKANIGVGQSGYIAGANNQLP
jgi:hypothetical protein